MKRVLISLLFLLFILSLSSCSIIDKKGGEVFLENSQNEVTKGQYDSICNKYSIGKSSTYKVFDSYDDYLAVYGLVSNEDLDIDDLEKDKESFNKNVKLCFARTEKGKNTICKPSYCYFSSDNRIIRSYGYFKNEEYKEDDVKYFIDFIDVPNNIYKKLKNNDTIKFV